MNNTYEFRGKSILVAGGGGFVGSHLCEALLSRGARVLAMDNFITGRIDNLSALMHQPGFELVSHDITERLEIPGPVDGIFHMASPASPVDYARKPIETLRAGASGADNLLVLAARKDCPILIASTSEIYGDPLEHPQKETYWGNVNPIGPRSCYDEAKRYQEALTMAYHRVHGVSTRIVRIFNTYGPRMRSDDGRVVPNFCTQALEGTPLTVYGDGSQTRSFCYVDDLVEGLLRLFASDYHEPVNLGNPSEHTILEFARKIIGITGSQSPIVNRPVPVDDPKLRCPDITTASRVLGWKPLVNLDEGLARTVAWFREQLASHRPELVHG